MFTGISHLTLFVHDQDKALQFYTKLGFKIHTDAMFGSDFRWLTLCLDAQPNVELVLMPAMTAQEKDLVGKQGAGKPFFSLQTSDCKGDYERLSKIGVKFHEAPKQEPWGISALFQDVEGNCIYMCQAND